MHNMSFALRSGRNARPATPGKEARIPGSADRFVGRDGEINASSRKDALRVLSQLMQEASAGRIDTSDARPDRAQEAKKRQEMLTAAYQDRSSGKWAELGATIAATVTESALTSSFTPW